MHRIRWSYGVTTVPARVNDLLPKTLVSLAHAGFHNPRIFLDGTNGLPESYYQQMPMFKGYWVTIRNPKVKTAANWFLSLLELYVRHPMADRFAIFQDDLVACRHLRDYLDACLYPVDGYWNLMTWPMEETTRKGWHVTQQWGKGAVALVFDSKAARALFSHPYMIDRFMSTGGHQAVDGGIVSSLSKKQGIKEYCHCPSLVEHTGKHSTMGNKRQPGKTSFRGEDFDARTLIQELSPCELH